VPGKITDVDLFSKLEMSASMRRTLFVLFFLSGFCALVYEIVWTRLAFASFGIIAPVLSIVLSIFMLGLSVGAWAGGRVISPLQAKTRWSPILFYGLAECVIGLSAFAVPSLFHVGEKILLSAGQMDSSRYLLFSAIVLGISVFPWCLCMGTTFPWMMAFVRAQNGSSDYSFSYLYVANVLGAMSGTALTAIVLVEALGFQGTLFVAACANFFVAFVSGILGWKGQRAFARPSSDASLVDAKSKLHTSSTLRRRLIKWILFSTGFCAMAMEVIWVRAFAPILKTQVYAFAAILFAYLGATFLGSVLYRRDLCRNRGRSTTVLMAALAIVVFLPTALNDVRLYWSNPSMLPSLAKSLVCSAILLLSICPFCMALGYLTPNLIDQDSGGDPAIAGRAYAINVLGCILGPLFASYILLPELGERYGLVLLGIPFVIFYFFVSKCSSGLLRFGVGLTAAGLLAWSLFFAVDFPTLVSRVTRAEVRRDYAASVVASGEGFDRRLFVNGIGMTGLLPTTKFMIHLPLLFHTGKAQSALIICFGMGTTFRSALSWDLETTAVELVPSVKNSFGYYHADAAQVRRNPKGRIVIDDGRRYLKRTRDKFDVIVIDPPPPVSAAGSSLLYSEEFYGEAKQHLNPDGILQAWLPSADTATEQAVLRSVQDCFPYLLCFRSPGDVGIHILASMQPVGTYDLDMLLNKMPANAAADLVEWSRTPDLSVNLEALLANPLSPEKMLNRDPNVRITDDRPYNEYFLLRTWGLL
jgi:spermidine synthase